MAALSYKARFAEYVEVGLQSPPRKKKFRIKRQTIRNFRKYPIKEGERLYHYYGMRTKWCRKLGESTCKAVHKITIKKNSIRIYNYIEQTFGMCKWVEFYDVTRLNRFAYADGFANWEEMRKWWTLTHGPDCFPFTGQLIKW